MKSWIDESWRLAALLAIALLLGLVLGHQYWVVAVALLIYGGWMIYRLHQLNRWLQKGAATEATPDTVGILNSVVQLVHREKRRTHRQTVNLKKTIERFSNLASELPDATVVLDERWQIIWCNTTAETLLGISRQRDSGQRIDNLMRDPDFITFLHDSRRDHKELELPSPVNADVTLLVTCVPAADRQQILSARDITQRVQVREMRKAFVADVSHELRTPLTVIQGHVEMLSENSSVATEDQVALERISEQSDRMAKIVEDLLTLSKLESRYLVDDEGVWVDFSTTIKSLASDLEAGGLTQSHDVELKLDHDLQIRGIESEMISCCQNLLQNAAAYTPAGTRIEIVWRQGKVATPSDDWGKNSLSVEDCSAGGACLVVRDYGPGIHPEHLPKLSQRFYRADQDRSRSTGGTGLGLAIVKHIAQRHGGQLNISSVIGEGSVFAVSFPASRIASGVTTSAGVGPVSPGQYPGSTTQTDAFGNAIEVAESTYPDLPTTRH